MELNELIAKYKSISNSAYSSNYTKLNSYEMGCLINKNKIEGNIVECGIAAGSNFSFMILGEKNTNEGIKRKYFGLDSFCGIQLAGPKDDSQPGIGAITHDVNVDSSELIKSSGITSHSKDNVITNLKSWDVYDQDVMLIEGWVQNTLTDSLIKEIGKISILRLDMDIYEPTKFALEKLYPLVSKNGIIIIDDWALLGAKTACIEYFSENNINPEIVTIKDSTPIYFVKP